MKSPRMHSSRWLLAGVLPLVVPCQALADAVTDWNATTNQVIGAAGGPPQQFRVFAMVHIAIHDALNAIDPRYKTYAAVGAGNPNASPDAAVARAARDVLLATLPTQAATINTAYTNFIAALPACAPAQPACISQGEAIGAVAADAILDMRVLDGSQTPHVPYTLGPAPGVYQPTPPTPPAPAPFPQFGGWGNLEPFALSSPWQFNPGRAAMLNIRSKAYAKDYNEVKAVGDAVLRNAAPDSEESRIARFWPGGGGNLNGVARVIVADYDFDLWEHARLFALMNMAINDGLVATFRVKYYYNFWRPYTAIHWVNDGNAGTQPDATWTSYIVTPPYPDYTCGLPNTVGSFAGVLREFFGTDAVPFTLTASGLPPAVTRSYTSLSQAADESADARVYGGIHFRTGCEAGVKLGEKVGKFVFKTQLRPQRKHH
ncbi:phosphatase PAP2 family protein [Lysobacter sp. S4-A87]|uniref:vanadium-dependent haloperoxidase n=1 Tax=Lysobacter sp. S4-A87 TaxID=2925843 RepID=UPI001F53B248|nr:vanadium-dependent haloperoxidase [Lysobacter sp. S4-A87]UNK48135.1 phosphatase PAP2 family protein [Lysobacter sp. S4-A87]